MLYIDPSSNGETFFNVTELLLAAKKILLFNGYVMGVNSASKLTQGPCFVLDKWRKNKEREGEWNGRGEWRRKEGRKKECFDASAQRKVKRKVMWNTKKKDEKKKEWRRKWKRKERETYRDKYKEEHKE